MKPYNLARPDIQAMKAYTPPLDGRRDYEGMLLDFNERSHSPTEEVHQALASMENLHRYPEYERLSVRLASYAKVEPEQVMITNGSNQAIDVIFRTFTEKGDQVIIPSPSFAMFRQAAQIVGNRIVEPLYVQTDAAFPLQEVLDAADKATRLVVICNPNNPTGTLLSLKDIKAIAEHAPRAVIMVDEAYFEFSNLTAVGLIAQYPNIIVTRTFSKAFGLAALRLGYVIATKEHIQEMLKVRGPYAVNMAAHDAALVALENSGETRDYVQEVITKAKPLVEGFFAEQNIPFYQSAANFILFRPPESQAVYEKLADKGILVRPQSGANIAGTLRLSIGTVEQMKQFVEAYRSILNE